MESRSKNFTVFFPYITWKEMLLSDLWVTNTIETDEINMSPKTKIKQISCLETNILIECNYSLEDCLRVKRPNTNLGMCKKWVLQKVGRSSLQIVLAEEKLLWSRNTITIMHCELNRSIFNDYWRYKHIDGF